MGELKVKDHSDLDAYTIPQFCKRHGISRGTYYKLKQTGQGPREGHVLGRVFITREAAYEWRNGVSKTPAANVWDSLGK